MYKTIMETSTFSLYCNIGNKIFDPVPDLDCSGDLCWVDVQPGSTVTGTITVENIGDPESLLDWEILSWPKWGTWTFDPNSGTDVLAGDTMTIDVEVIWPDPDNSSGGEVVLVNSEDPDDVCIVSIQMAPPPSFPITLIGKISDLKFNNESISFLTDFVILIFIIIPAISINDDMAIKNDYRGFIGDRFICAYCWT